MSKVMQQLKHSERRHLASGSTLATSPLMASPQHKHSFGLGYLALAIVPPILVAAMFTVQSYQSEKEKWLQSNIAQTVTIPVPFEYQTFQAPDFGPLAATYQQHDDTLPDEAGDTDVGNASLPSESVNKTHSLTVESQESNEELLQGIDLSDFSPELAQRFETVLNSTPSVEKADENDAALNLSHHSERWYGKLPAMNFQTHVYSSKANKRWVKINGAEYSEGEWIDREVELVAIEQQSCLIRFRGDLIEVPALYDWKG